MLVNNIIYFKFNLGFQIPVCTGRNRKAHVHGERELLHSHSLISSSAMKEKWKLVLALTLVTCLLICNERKACTCLLVLLLVSLFHLGVSLIVLVPSSFIFQNLMIILQLLISLLFLGLDCITSGFTVNKFADYFLPFEVLKTSSYEESLVWQIGACHIPLFLPSRSIKTKYFFVI